MNSSSLVVGIDLGTTNSCVSIYRDGNVQSLENKEGDRTTPSYLHFSDKKPVVVGKYAKKMADMKPEHAVYEMKRLIGREFSDPNIQKNLQYLSFDVKDVDGKPVVEVNTGLTTHRKTPEELSAFVLKKIKNDVEDKLGETISKAVITVPAYFNVSQRDATLQAANQAGFNVLKLLNEPTAAALCYYYKNPRSAEDYSLIYDLGGGTFDVAILKRTRTNIDIVCVDGDSHLGGQDLDNLIVDYVCKILEEQYDSIPPKSNRRIFRRLKNKCEEAKKDLSYFEETEINLEAFFHKGDDLIQIPLSREEFERMAEGLFKKTIDIVDQCLKSSKLTKRDIKDVILAGGSTRIPKIQDMLQQYFDGKVLNKFNNPDESVADGAALQAAMLSTNPQQSIEKIRIIDVVPLSIGTSIMGNLMQFVIRKNSPIPVSKSVSLFNSRHPQSSMRFDIFEGERIDPRKNYLLGNFTLENVTHAPPGQCEAVLTMSVDQNGILTITAKEKLRNNSKDLKIVYTKGRRSENEVKSATADARRNEKEDEQYYKFAKAKQSLLKYCSLIIYNLENKQLEDTYRNIYNRVEDIYTLAEAFEMDQEKQMDILKKEIVEKCSPLVFKHNFEYMRGLENFL